MQDSAMAHTVNFSLTAVEAVFGGRSSHSGLWHYSPPDFDLFDYYLWRTLEDRVYVNIKQFFIEFIPLWYIVSNIDMSVAINRNKV
jgi:hypothetical protein